MNNFGCDQAVHSHSLVSINIIQILESIKATLAISKFSRLKLVSVAEHAGSNLTWSQTTKTDFLLRCPQKKVLTTAAADKQSHTRPSASDTELTFFHFLF